MDLRRKKSRTLILFSLIIFCLIFLYSSSSNNDKINKLLILSDNNNHNNKDINYSNYEIVTKSSWTVNNNNNIKHVTKSLSELGTTPSVNNAMLFFNRVPKCGSEMLVLLITWLEGINSFKHFRLPGGIYHDRQLNRLKQEKIVDTVKKHIRESAVPTSFDRHIYFTNFSSFGTQNPIYINLIRDPISKMQSRYYYADIKKRKQSYLFDKCVENDESECSFIDGQHYDLAIPYFCGHDDWCNELNSDWALEKAKENVEKYYKVVGVLEHLNETLAVLENKIPQYFKGLQNLYFNELLEPHKNKNRHNPREIKPSTEQKLKNSFRLEYEFYHFIKSRLLNQYTFIDNHNN